MLHSPQTLTHLQRLWAYITLGGTGIITEEAAPLIGGLAAHNGHLRLTMVMFYVALGTWGAGILLYYVGRWRGDWLRRRWPRLRGIMLRTLKLVRRHPWRASLSTRFAYGLRWTLPVACGAARVPIALYLVGSAISAVVWSVTFTLIGWALGETALLLVGHVRRYEKWIALGIVVVLMIGFWAMRRRHVADEVVDVLATGDRP